MRLRFWGTRGSIATPGPSTLRYGGNTSCVELRSAAGTLVVFDCGTGARALGRTLVEEAAGAPLEGAILLGHTHWDHIQGLPFFEPLFGRGHWDIYGPRGLGGSLDQTLAGQMNYQYFPVAIDQLGAEIEYHELVEGTFEIGDLVVRTQYLNHPALTLGYRVEGDGVTVCYLADHELFDASLASGGDVSSSREDARHVEFMRDADVVIHDAQYDASEYASRTGWGHSTMQYVVDAAVAASVATTVLFHHDPSHDDEAVDDLVARANERAAGRTAVLGAAEGLILDVAPAQSNGSTPRRTQGGSAEVPALDDVAATVIVATTDPGLRAAIETAARAEQLVVVSSGDDLSTVDGRVIVVVDVDTDTHVTALEALHASLPASVWARRGMLAVTRTLGAAAKATSVATAVTDWLVWPATAAHARTKLRATLLRRACRWMAAPAAADEGTRLAALHALGLLDTDAESRFDRFTTEACSRFGVPIALITLVDRERQWFKSRIGIDVPETPRDQSLCAHAILGDDVMQVPDLLDDARFADSPAATGEGRIRFYAGAPLTLADGSCVGTLCIADHRPRLLDDDDLDALRHLAHEVVEQMSRP